MILPRFITVPLAAFGARPDPHVTAGSGPPDYPPIVQQDPAQWFDAWKYPGDCPPVPAVASVRATPGPGQVTLGWPGAGLDIHYRVYLQGPGEQGRPGGLRYRSGRATITGLRPGHYRAKVVPVNFYSPGPAAGVTFTVP